MQTIFRKTFIYLFIYLFICLFIYLFIRWPPKNIYKAIKEI